MKTAVSVLGLALLLSYSFYSQAFWFDKGESHVFTAIKAKDYQTAREIIAGGNIDIHARNDKNYTFLHLSNDPQLSRQLIELGADVNADAGGRDSGLKWAPRIPTGNSKIDSITKRMKEKGSDQRPLHMVQNIEVAKLLIAAGAEVDAVNSHGETALHRHARSADWVTLLLKHGANVNAKTNYNNTPLMKAVDHMGRGKDWSAVRFMVEAGAAVNAQNNMGSTALHHIRWDNGDLAQYLIESGADVELATNYGNIPLCHAIADNAKYLITLYLVRGKGILSRCSQDRDIYQYAKEKASRDTQQYLVKSTNVILRELKKSQTKEVGIKNNEQ